VRWPGDKITDAVLAAGFPDSSSYYRKADARWA
jgi:AraC family transcriptional regulator of adaptative response/methylated-DNA-[protein]-cysteine methyltransferase